MPNTVTVKITGLDQLEKQLYWMKAGKAETLIKEAVAQASTAITKSIANEAPEGIQHDFKRPGAFNIVFKKAYQSLSKSAGVLAAVSVSGMLTSKPGTKSGKTAGWKPMRLYDIARWVEFGHLSRITNALGKVRGKAWQKKHGTMTPANPFFTRGWELSKNQALNIFVEKLKELCN